MEVAVSQLEGKVPVTVLRIKGDLSDETVLIAEAKKVYENGARHLLLDLTDVPYISSGGLRGLHAVWMLFREDTSEAGNQAIKQGISKGTYQSRHFKLVNPSKNALKALTVSGYDMFLEVHKHVKDAVQSF